MKFVNVVGWLIATSPLILLILAAIYARRSWVLIAILLCPLLASGAEDEEGFLSIAEHLVGDPSSVSYFAHQSIDELFDTRDVAKRLAAEKRVRLFRKPQNTDDLLLAYYDLERKHSLSGRLGKQLPTVEIAEANFRPVLTLAADFNNYGDKSICGFDAGVAVIIGGEEPDYILVCCFKCHDMHIVRRPTVDHPMPQVAEVGMSPKLERAIFTLARGAYPTDKELQSFKLAERTRSKTPILKSTGGAKDPFSSNESETPKK